MTRLSVSWVSFFVVFFRMYAVFVSSVAVSHLLGLLNDLTVEDLD